MMLLFKKTWCYYEKYEIVNGKHDIPYMKWKIKNVPNHQPENDIIIKNDGFNKITINHGFNKWVCCYYPFPINGGLTTNHYRVITNNSHCLGAISGCFFQQCSTLDQTWRTSSVRIHGPSAVSGNCSLLSKSGYQTIVNQPPKNEVQSWGQSERLQTFGYRWRIFRIATWW